MNMLEKEFIPYNLALALKELGFDKEICFGWWTYRYDSTEGYLDTLKTYCFQIKDDLNRQCLAPLYQQAFRWFREKYELFCSIDLTDNSRSYHFNFTISDSINRDWNDIDCFDSCKRIYDFEKLDTYEKAEIECLKKLIQIVKARKI